MAWSTTSDVRAFADRAFAFLAADPVAHTALLTEVAYLLRHPEPSAVQLYGWWSEPPGAVAGAFVQAPRHPVLLSLVPEEAVSALVSALPDLTRIGVDERYADRIRSSSPGESEELARITVHQLERSVPLPSAEGNARTATSDDLPLLAYWFDLYKAARPEDPSDRAFVIDDPLDDGGIVLWEVGGGPVAMSSRTPLVAGMTRMGLVFSPDEDRSVERAVFAAACERARQVAAVVLTFSSDADPASAALLRELGFTRVGGRALLAIGEQDDV